MAILFAAATLLPVTKSKVKKFFSYRETEGDPTSITARNLLSWKIKNSSNRKKSSTSTGNGSSSSSSSSICFSSKVENQTQTTETHVKKTPKKVSHNSFLSQGRDEDENHGVICPGCGVFMQNTNPNLPGFFQERKVPEKPITDTDETFDDDILMELEEIEDGFESTVETSDDDDEEEEEGDFDWDSDSDWDELDKKEDKLKKELDAFSPAGVGYGNVTEETLKRGKRERISKSERKKRMREAVKDVEEVTVCARCHSLRNYGHVKNEKVENLIPDFDFDRLITTRLMKPTGTSDASVVVMVVDCVDFDGSFPKRASKSLFKALEGTKKDFKRKLPTLVLVATKVDLLPSQVSPTRLDKWVRHRARANGAPKIGRVYLVSAHKDLGVRNLLLGIKELAGPRGNVWVIGARNAGKSTLINAFSKKEGKKPTKLTEAAVPGTTLGILRIGGILPAKAKMFDTPGLLHSYLMSLRLNRDEQKMIEIRKQLQPRSYRIKAGQTVHVGGLLRLDLNQASVETIYVTVFASASISLHLGKTENADETWRKHVGIRLQPPVSEDHVTNLEQLQKSEFKISGISWDVNSTDIAVAGLGWISLGLKGQANVTLYSHEGVEVTLREPLVLDRARFLERPGFLLPKAISEALGQQSKLEAQKKKKLEEEEEAEEILV